MNDTDDRHKIIVKGAQENNLKGLNITLDKHELITFTGVSGSGKSSLVFDTIYASAQVEFYGTLSTYIVKNLPKINKPKVDKIENLSPCVVIDQKPLGSNPRSTVGTVTEIYSYLRLLFSRVGLPIMDSEYFSFNTPKGACEKCKGLGQELTPDLNKLLSLDKSLNNGAVKHRTWVVGSRYFNIQKAIGYFDMDKKLRDFTDDEMENLLYAPPTQYQNKAAGYVQSFSYEGIISRIMKRQGDSRGLEINSYDEQFFNVAPCSECHGSRLNTKARSVVVNDNTLVDLLSMELDEVYDFVKSLTDKVSLEIAEHILGRLKTLIDLGLGYLTLNRSVPTLSNGEAQKVKIAKHNGSALNELIYVMDEPSLGLHHRDTKKLTKSLHEIKNRGNTMLVVEHNRYIIEQSDKIADIGPGAGNNGGKLLFYGAVANVRQDSSSVTGCALNSRPALNMQKPTFNKWHTFDNITINNLNDASVKMPDNALTCITGVSGSGKSSLIDYLTLNNPYIIKIGGETIGTSSRSIVATYTGIFDLIRKEFAVGNNVDAALFSFNSKGACSSCKGIGEIVMDMHFLGDVRQECDECHGRRYNGAVLKYLHNGKNINDVLNMTVDEAHGFFKNTQIVRKLQLLKDLGLSYLELGQSLITLSGGEARRVSMIDQLAKTGEIYILDEPTSGLHLQDIDMLFGVIKSIINRGNTVIVIEHNLDFIVRTDYLIDLGPDGGKNGGRVIFSGYPSDILNEQSFTADAIREFIA